jgi:hypothetical protein
MHCKDPRVVLTGLAALALGASGPAAARGVAVDYLGGFLGSISPGEVTLPFDVQVKSVTTNKIFVYSEGLISIGKPLSSADFNVTALTDITDAYVVTPFFIPPALGPPGPTTGMPIFEGVVTDPSLPPEVDIDFEIGSFLLGSQSFGDVGIEFHPGNIDNPPTNYVIDLGDASQCDLALYNPASCTFEGLPETLPAAFPQGDNFSNDISYSPTPEPRSWTMLIAGLGLLGAALRGGAVRRAGA